MRTPWIVGNWKSNTLRAEARELAAATDALAKGSAVDLGVAPPALWCTDVVAAAPRVSVFAQNVSATHAGAFTGEWTARMLSDAGAAGAIVGHSERRAMFGDTDAVVGSKVARLREVGLHAIICVGETLAQREAGETVAVVLRQLEAAVATLDDAAELTVAYEPVWAIGTGQTASPAQAQAVHAELRAWWATRFDASAAKVLRIQYGGSVKGSNAAELLAQEDVDGALVGGASLTPEAFGAIVSALAPLLA